MFWERRISTGGESLGGVCAAFRKGPEIAEKSYK